MCRRRRRRGAPSRVRILPEAVHTAAAGRRGARRRGRPDRQLADLRRRRRAAAGAHLRRAPGRHRQGRRAARRHRAAAGPRPSSSASTPARPIGGVAPLGHPKPVRTLVDTALAEYDEIWAAGGVPQAVFPTTYAELVRITAGTAGRGGVSCGGEPCGWSRGRPDDLLRRLDDVLAVYGEAMGYRRRRSAGAAGFSPPTSAGRTSAAVATLDDRRPAARLRLRLPLRARASGGTTRCAPALDRGQRAALAGGLLRGGRAARTPDRSGARARRAAAARRCSAWPTGAADAAVHAGGRRGEVPGLAALPPIRLRRRAAATSSSPATRGRSRCWAAPCPLCEPTEPSSSDRHALSRRRLDGSRAASAREAASTARRRPDSSVSTGPCARRQQPHDADSASCAHGQHSVLVPRRDRRTRHRPPGDGRPQPSVIRSAPIADGGRPAGGIPTARRAARTYS